METPHFIKGTLMWIWKSSNIFVFKWKCAEDFTLKHLLLFEICARDILEKVCLQTFKKNRICPKLAYFTNNYNYRLLGLRMWNYENIV